MSPAVSADLVRAAFHDEIDQLGLQVEMMALLVRDAIAGSAQVAGTGDAAVAAAMLGADDEIDAMHTSLTEKCIQLLVREQPVASDLRTVLSVMRVIDSLERMGDLSLRIANQAHEVALINRHPAVAAVLSDLGQNVINRFDAVVRAWSSRSLDALADLDETDPLDKFGPPLMQHITELRGTDAARVAVAAFIVGRSLDRIGDHASVVANRLRFMLTGDIEYLAAEVE